MSLGAPRRRLRQRRPPGPLGYRPGLDGVRALAVVAVMAFHAGISWIPGGFLGVDMFFVVSGFLITTLLMDEYATTRSIKLSNFWGRRAKRLLPALFLMLAVVAIYGATWAPQVTRSGLRWDALASLFYVANWRFIFGHVSYFAGFAAPSPLRHMWSLAVEEQWYLLWPPFLTFLLYQMRGRTSGKQKLNVLLAVLITLCLLSWAQMLRLDLQSHGAADGGRSYYGTDTHIQVLLVGAILAIVRLRWWPATRRLRNLWRLAGIPGVIGAVVMLIVVKGSDRWMYQGGFLLFAILSAGVVAATVVGGGVVARAFSLRWARAIGRVSYGLYLWHWPIDVALTPQRLDIGFWPLLIVRTLVTAVITVASYKLLEVPVRRGEIKLRKPLQVTFTTVGLLAIMSVALPSISSGSRPKIDISSASPSTLPPHAKRPVAHQVTKLIPQVPAGQPIRVLVVGDSVGQALTNEVTPPPGFQFSNESAEGCGLTFGEAIVGGYPIYDTPQCPATKQNSEWLAGMAGKPNVVVMSYGTWEVFDQEYNGTDYRVGSTAYRTLLLAQLQADINFFARYGNPHVVLLNVPCYAETNYSLGGSSSARNDPSRIAWVNGVFSQFANANPGRVTLLPISQWDCPGGKFAQYVDGVELRPDGVHFDPQAATLTWQQWLGPRVRSIAAKPAYAPQPSKLPGVPQPPPPAGGGPPPPPGGPPTSGGATTGGATTGGSSSTS